MSNSPPLKTHVLLISLFLLNSFQICRCIVDWRSGCSRSLRSRFRWGWGWGWRPRWRLDCRRREGRGWGRWWRRSAGRRRTGGSSSYRTDQEFRLLAEILKKTFSNILDNLNEFLCIDEQIKWILKTHAQYQINCKNTGIYYY